jgi:hypothetical protein
MRSLAHVRQAVAAVPAMVAMGLVLELVAASAVRAPRDLWLTVNGGRRSIWQVADTARQTGHLPWSADAWFFDP